MYASEDKLSDDADIFHLCTGNRFDILSDPFFSDIAAVLHIDTNLDDAISTSSVVDASITMSNNTSKRRADNDSIDISVHKTRVPSADTPLFKYGHKNLPPFVVHFHRIIGFTKV